MADKQHEVYVEIKNDEKDSLGSIQVASDVLEIIATTALNEVEGVVFPTNISNSVVEKLMKKFQHKPVQLEWKEKDLNIDVKCAVKYGFSIPKVAKEAQASIQEAVRNMTLFHVSEINIHVTGVHFDTPSQ